MPEKRSFSRPGLGSFFGEKCAKAQKHHAQKWEARGANAKRMTKNGKQESEWERDRREAERGLENIISVVCVDGFLMLRSGSVVDGCVEDCEGRGVDGVKALADVDFPGGGGPVEAMFDDMVRELCADQDEAGSDADGVRSDAGYLFAVEVLGVGVGVFGGLPEGLGD